MLTVKMLKHAGMLEPQDPGVMPFDETVDLELRWKDWMRREHNNRYTNSNFLDISAGIGYMCRLYSLFYVAENGLARTYLRPQTPHLYLSCAATCANI
jgi:hypothetical protein